MNFHFMKTWSGLLLMSRSFFKSSRFLKWVEMSFHHGQSSIQSFKFNESIDFLSILLTSVLFNERSLCSHKEEIATIEDSKKTTNKSLPSETTYETKPTHNSKQSCHKMIVCDMKMSFVRFSFQRIKNHFPCMNKWQNEYFTEYSVYHSYFAFDEVPSESSLLVLIAVVVFRIHSTQTW